VITLVVRGARGNEDVLAALRGRAGVASGRITGRQEGGALVTFLVSAQAAGMIGVGRVIGRGTLRRTCHA
jgi:hypothetical protein